MKKEIQEFLWELSGYDLFLVKHCPIIHNRIGSIGIFFLFQILIVFVSVTIAYYVFFNNYLLLGVLMGIMVSYMYYLWLKFINKFQQIYSQSIVCVALFVIYLIISFLLSIPFCLNLFEDRIIFRIYLNTQKLDIGLLDQFWLKPFGLYQEMLNKEGGVIIFYASFAVLILVLFIFTTPMFFRYRNKKMYYYLVKQAYETGFNAKK